VNDSPDKELRDALTRYHREVVGPEFQRLLDKQTLVLRTEMLKGFNEANRRLDRIIELVVETRKIAERAARSIPSS